MTILFSAGQDPRNTDNAWMETVAIHFHDEKGDKVPVFGHFLKRLLEIFFGIHVAAQLPRPPLP